MKKYIVIHDDGYRTYVYPFNIYQNAKGAYEDQQNEFPFDKVYLCKILGLNSIHQRSYDSST